MGGWGWWKGWRRARSAHTAWKIGRWKRGGRGWKKHGPISSCKCSVSTFPTPSSRVQRTFYFLRLTLNVFLPIYCTIVQYTYSLAQRTSSFLLKGKKPLRLSKSERHVCLSPPHLFQDFRGCTEHRDRVECDEKALSYPTIFPSSHTHCCFFCWAGGEKRAGKACLSLSEYFLSILFRCYSKFITFEERYAGFFKMM